MPNQPEPEVKAPTLRDSILRAIAVIGLIAILILGAWGIIQLVVSLPDFVANFGSHTSSLSTTTPSTNSNTTSGEQVTVAAPATVTSGQPFVISWSHTGGGNYSYQLSYSCATGVSFAAPTPTGQYQQVACNTPFNYTNASANLQLVAVLSANQPQTTATIVVNAIRLSDTKVTSSGKAEVAIAPAKAAAQTAQPAKPAATTKPSTSSTNTSSAYTASGHTSNLYGSADLSAQIISITPTGTGRYAAQFVIKNTGTNVAAYGWTFTAQIPTTPTYTFVSQPQQKLYPGDKIVYTLGFDAPANYGYGYAPYQNLFSVTADAQYLVGDSNRTNNTASAPVGY